MRTKRDRILFSLLGLQVGCLAGQLVTKNNLWLIGTCGLLLPILVVAYWDGILSTFKKIMRKAKNAQDKD